MKFKSYHLRWGVIAIGCFLILLGFMEGVLKIRVNEKLEHWLMSSLFISAAVLFIYMKKYEKQEAEEAKQEKKEDEDNSIPEKTQSDNIKKSNKK